MLGGKRMPEYNEREERQKYRAAARKLHKLVPCYKVWTEDIDDNTFVEISSIMRGKYKLTRLGKYIIQYFYNNPKARNPQNRQNTFYILASGIYENPEDNEKIKIINEEGEEETIEVSETQRHANALKVAKMLASVHLLDKYKPFR